MKSRIETCPKKTDEDAGEQRDAVLDREGGVRAAPSAARPPRAWFPGRRRLPERMLVCFVHALEQVPDSAGESAIENLSFRPAFKHSKIVAPSIR